MAVLERLYLKSYSLTFDEISRNRHGDCLDGLKLFKPARKYQTQVKAAQIERFRGCSTLSPRFDMSYGRFFKAVNTH